MTTKDPVCSKIYIGNVIHSKSIDNLECLRNAAVGVSAEGTIMFVSPSADESALKEYRGAEIKRLGSKEILLPGFIDTHTHAPQYYFMGLGGDLQLIQWLKKYTFPCEAKFSDPAFASKVYSMVVKRGLRNGTTTSCYFGTIQLPACKILADQVEQAGVRALIGKVCMDQNSPPFYIEDTKDSIAKTKEFIEYVMAKKKPTQIIPVITPRFAPTCTMELMKGLAQLATEYSLPIQTHLSENRNECKWVAELFPDCKSYTAVYEAAGLLNERTILAHCVYLSEEEQSTLLKHKAGVAHCANSNFALMSGAMTSKAYMEKKMKVGLGTDVAGGWSPSMLNAIRQAVTAAKLKVVEDPRRQMLTLGEAFYMATVGGAEVLGLEKEVGNFAVGKQFDAQVVNMDESNVDLYGYESLDDLFAKFIYLGDDRNVKEVYVQGKCVYTG